jgi:phosphohistidine phosphatase
MMLYLLRHGEAEAQAATDASRKLTGKGGQEVISVGLQFLENKLPLQRCISSPYVRALQTAELFLEQVSPTLPVEESDTLTPDVRASEVMKLLETLREEHVLLVSHNPLMSELNALLADGDISQMHILGTSELVVISVEIIGLGMGKKILRLLPEANVLAN